MMRVGICISILANSNFECHNLLKFKHFGSKYTEEWNVQKSQSYGKIGCLNGESCTCTYVCSKRSTLGGLA